MLQSLPGPQHPPVTPKPHVQEGFGAAFLSGYRERGPDPRLWGEDSPGWAVLPQLPLDSLPEDALGLTDPSPGGFSRGALALGPDTNCGMGTWGRQSPAGPRSTLFQQGWGGGMFWGVVSPCPASTHREICLTGARKPDVAIKYYLDAMRCRLASSSALRDARGGQRACGSRSRRVCPDPGSAGGSEDAL